MQATKPTVRKCLLLATMVTKGTSVSDVTGDMVEAWHGSAVRHGIGDDDFKAAFQAVVDRSTFFPAWAEVLAEHGRRMSDRFACVTDPVIVLDGDDRRIGSRALCEAAGVAFSEIQDEPPRCLPPTEGGRKLLASVLEATKDVKE